MVLIGHSYGGTLAAAYAASHPERVEKMVLSSPGDPSPSAGGASMTFRLTTEEKLGVYALLLPPRPMLAYALLQVNPEAAHAFAGDKELDARFDLVYNRTRPALHCRNKPLGPRLHGLGFYAHYYRQSATSPPHENFLPALAEQEPPALIIKGRCDYLSGSSAVEYLGRCPTQGLSTCRSRGTMPTRTSRSASWPGCGRSCRGDPCPSFRTRVPVCPRATKGHHEHERDQGTSPASTGKSSEGTSPGCGKRDGMAANARCGRGCAPRRSSTSGSLP